MTAGSAPAMARNTIPRAGSVRGRRRRTYRFLPIPSCLTARSRSADAAVRTLRPDHERTIDLPAAKPVPEVVGGATPHHGARAFVLRRLSDPTQSELLVDLRRNPFLHAGGTD